MAQVSQSPEKKINNEKVVEFEQEKFQIKETPDDETPKFSKQNTFGEANAVVQGEAEKEEVENPEVVQQEIQEEVQEESQQEVSTEPQEQQESQEPQKDLKVEDDKAEVVEEEVEVEEEEEEEVNPKYLEYLQKAETFKKEGNEFFKAKNYPKARSKYARVFSYTRSLNMNTSSDSISKMALDSKGKIPSSLSQKAKILERDSNSNLCMVYIQEKNWSRAILKATLSLEIEETAKAYFRRGKSYAMKNDFENAYKDFKTGIEKFNGEKALFEGEIEKTKKRERKYDRAEAQRFSKAMQE